MQTYIESIECLVKWFILSDVSDSDVTFVLMYNPCFRKGIIG